MGRLSANLTKRLALAAAILVVLGVGFVLLAPRLVSIEVVRRSMSREIAGWSGRSLTFDGTPSVAFTPYLTVTFPHVTIGSTRDQTVLVEMDQLRAQVPILPLIFRGRIEPSAFDFRRPRFHFKVDTAGVANWDLPKGLDVASPLRQLTVTDGSLDYEDGLGRSVEVSKIDAILDWPDPHKAASIQGRATWQGVSADIYAAIDSPAGLLEGDTARIRFALESQPLRGSFDGTARQIDGLTASGRLSLSTPSISRLADLLAVPMGRLPRLGLASIDSGAELSRGTLTLGDAALTLDGNQGVGAISLSLAEARPSVQATLAFDVFDATSYVAATRSILAVSRAAPDAPLGWPTLDRINADLRLSTDQLRLGDTAVGRMAASLALRDGRLDIAVGDMQVYGARVTASLSAGMHDATPSASLQAKIDGLPLKTALSDLAGIEALDGTASGTLSLQGRGASWNALVASLAGRGSASIVNGTVGGINLSVLTGSTGQAAALESRLFNGATAFGSAKADFTIGSGSVSAPEIAAAGTDFRVEMSAEARLGEAGIRGHGAATLAGRRVPPLAVPFDLGGTWSHPVLVPDFADAAAAPAR